MEEIFKLTMDEPFENSTHISSTSQILQDCLLIIESPSHDSYKSSDSNSPVSTKSNNYSDHPDILYFQKSNRRIISSFINQNFKQSGILIK